MANEQFKVLSDVDHVLQRPNTYIGSVDKGLYREYILEDGKFFYKEIEYIPGIMKLINEVIDNSVDESIRTNFEYASKIKVNFDDEAGMISVEDNGRGIQVEKFEDGSYIPEKAWCHARSGTNFSNDDRETIGMNGLGVFLTVCYSKYFKGETSDGKNKCIVETRNNLQEKEVSVRKNSKQYTIVEFELDLEKFKIQKDEIFSENSIYKTLTYQRLLNLSICYPKISFIFNGKAIHINSQKGIMSLFGDKFEYVSNDKCIIGVFPNQEDDFKFYSYVNGLRLPKGGSHIDLISSEVTQFLREKLSRKYKSIKPGEIKNKLFVVCYGWNFPNLKFDSQTKEQITNSTKELRDFFDDIDFDKFSQKIFKNENIIDPIIEIYKIKEEYNKRKEIDSVKKTKNVKDSSYLPPIGSGKLKHLILGEGRSAVGLLSATLGRDGYGYYELTGKPLNAYKTETLKILKNKILRTLIEILDIEMARGEMETSQKWFQINHNEKEYIVNENDYLIIDNKYINFSKDVLIDNFSEKKYKAQSEVRRRPSKKNMSYDDVVLGADFDLDGSHIRGLLLGFFAKYTPNLIEEERIYELRTPLIIFKKGDKIEHFFFDFASYQNFISKNDIKKYTIRYMKGMASWNQEELTYLFNTYGLGNFLRPYKWTDDTMSKIHQWLASDEVDARKDLLLENEFDILTT